MFTRQQCHLNANNIMYLNFYEENTGVCSGHKSEAFEGSMSYTERNGASAVTFKLLVEK